ncbi:MAG: hypothetical protein QOC96_1145 [Acidobacteriota bacterium]|jgi:hypothetical protein|nr:hypothetical protein [Acidobacteriota bacterium]
MGKVRRSTLLGLTLLLSFVAGCKVSCTTANISSLKFSKDEAGTIQTKEFAPNDTIYARANVSNNGSTVTLKFRLVAEKVEGVKENDPVRNTDYSIDLASPNNYAVYDLHRDGGWPPGRYRVEVVMLYSGEQKDQKSDTFTVTGGGGGVAKPSPAATTSTPGANSEDNANDSENSSPHGEH